MRDRNDPGSQEMFPGSKRGRGRPALENKLTPAERSARYRERKKLESEGALTELQREVRRLKRKLSSVTKNMG